MANVFNYKEKELLLISISESLNSITDEDDVKLFFEQQLKGDLLLSDMMVLLTNEDNESQHIFFNYTEKENANNDSPICLFDKKNIPVNDGVINAIIAENNPLLWSLEELSENKKARYVNFWLSFRFKAIIGLPIISRQKTIGVVFFTSVHANAFDAENLSLIKLLTTQLANVILNIQTSKVIAEIQKEKETLLKISDSLIHSDNKNDIYESLNENLKDLFPISEIITCLTTEDTKWGSPYVLDKGASIINHHGYSSMINCKCWLNDDLIKIILSAANPLIFDLEELISKNDSPEYFKLMYKSGMKEIVFSAFGDDKNKTGIIILFSGGSNKISNNNLVFFQTVSTMVSLALSNIQAKETSRYNLHRAKHQLQQNGNNDSQFPGKIQSGYPHHEIIGSSEIMKNVFKLISQVAVTQTSVLISGETGTGKELIARAVHNSSSRKDKRMIKINCANLPANLIESELFGHEKGSFTGATERRIGKFELANHSTLFLDEIGELPPELQVKILRVLQEREFERIGGNNTIKTDVRIIAATNRDLLQDVKMDKFRSDLYFRLNVFPITIPPLRERKEDIPILASHFLIKHAKKETKGPMSFSSSALKQMISYNWPGNVREMEHVIERAILLTNQNVIKQIVIPAAEKNENEKASLRPSIKTIDEVEREYIISVLKMCGGKVAGIYGAAKALHIPSTTLNSKIKRLKIEKEYIDCKSKTA